MRCFRWPHLLAALSCSLISPFAKGENLPIKDLPKRIQSSNPVLKAAEKDVQIAEEDLNQAKDKFLPSIEWNSSFTRMNEDLVIDIPNQRLEREFLNGSLQIGLDIDPPPVTIHERDVWNSHFLLKQPIFAGGRLRANYQASVSQEAIRQHERQLIEDQQLLLALQRYFQVKLSQHLLESLTNLRTRLEKIDQISQSLVKAGTVPSYTNLRTKSALAELDAKIEEAQSILKVLRIAMATLIGQNDLSEESFISPLKILDIPLDRTFWTQEAIQNRREFLILEEQKNRTQVLMDAARGSMLPSLYAFGKYELIPDQLTAMQPQWAVGVGMNWELSQGLKALPEIRKAALLAEKVKIGHDRAMREIPLQVGQVMARVRGAKASLAAIEQARNLAEESLRIAEVRYASGNGSHLDVLNDYSDLEKLILRRWQLVEEYNRHVLELHAASSLLPEYIARYESQ